MPGLHLQPVATSGTPTIGPNNDTDTGIGFPSANTLQLIAGGTVGLSLTTSERISKLIYTTSVDPTDGSTPILAIANPLGQAGVILGCEVEVLTPEGGTCTLDVGVAADAATTSDTLLDNINGNATAGTIYSTFNATDSGTNGAAGKMRKMSSSQYVTVTKASGTVNNVIVRVSLWMAPY